MSIAGQIISVGADAGLGENPFAEAQVGGPPEPLGFLPWAEGLNPFAEAPSLDGSGAGETDALAAEAYESLRDETFDEALAELVAETEQAAGERFEGEFPGQGAERTRRATVHLAPVGLEAERYLDALSDGLTGTDLESLTEASLEALLERLDPDLGALGLSPASEQFIGRLVNKAKAVVTRVVQSAKKVASTVGNVAGHLLSPVLQKLRGLVRPLLQRVLAFAIGKLPAPLQGPARTLAGKIALEAEDLASAADTWEAEDDGESLVPGGFSPTVSTDPERLAEQFDEALAAIIATAGRGAGEPEAFASGDGSTEGEQPAASDELEALASARGELIARLASAEGGADLAPTVENFVPALLGALRLGVRMVGRQRVVGFLARYLGNVIRPFVGPQMTGPLSAAIVDTGLKLLTLETEEPIGQESAAPIALAATIEDTVRRLAEQEDYVLDSEDLLQLATAEAFEHAVATNFPARYVKARLQQAPTIGGSFVTINARSLHPYRRYSRSPEVEITAQLADTVPSFGGATLGDALRAAGVVLPMRARVHIVATTLGSTLTAIVGANAHLRRLGPRGGLALVHPLTPLASGLLLREPRLGSPVPPAYLASRGRLAVGQRLYWLERIGAAGRPDGLAGEARTPGTPGPASRARLVIDLPRGEVRVALYSSEADAQAIATAIRAGRGVPELLRTLTRTYGQLRSATGRSVLVRRELTDSEELAAGQIRRLPPAVLDVLRKRVRAWLLTSLTQWARTRLEEYSRAAAAPENGVSVQVKLAGVPGLPVLSAALSGTLNAAELRGVLTGTAFRGTPSSTVTVLPGRRLR